MELMAPRRGPQRRLVGHFGEELPDAAANHRPVIDRVRETGPRLEAGLLNRTVARKERRGPDVFPPQTVPPVVAKAAICRQTLPCRPGGPAPARPHFTPVAAVG